MSEMRGRRGEIEYGQPYHWYRRNIWLDIQAERIKFAKEYLNSTDIVLDIGCGDGFVTNELSKICSRIVGLDVSTSGLLFAKDLSEKKVNYILANAIKLPFKDSSFDVVTAFEVIEHLPEETVSYAIDEICRVLKEKGEIIITTPNPKNLRNRLTGKKKVSDKHFKEYTIESLKRILRDFDYIEMRGIYLYGPFPLTKIRLFRRLLIKLGRLFPGLSFNLCFSGRKK